MLTRPFRKFPVRHGQSREHRLASHHLVVAGTHRLLVASSATANANSTNRAAATGDIAGDTGGYFFKAKGPCHLVVFGSLQRQ